MEDNSKKKKNFFRHIRLNSEDYLITNEAGNYSYLSEKEFESFCDNILNDREKIKELEEKGFYLTKASKENFVSKCKKKKSFLKQGPSLHIVILTLRCNQKCIYCHAASRGESEKKYDMTKETAKTVVDRIFDTPSPHITIEFQGGEPTLNIDIMLYIADLAREKNKIHRKDLKLTVVSNLLGFSDDILKKLMDNKIMICTSFDGPKELHDKNRPYGKGSSYDEIIKWVRLIEEKWKEGRPNALVTITKESLKYPEGIVDEYVKNDFTGLHLRFLNNLGFAKKNKEIINYTAEEFVDFWKKAMEYIIDLNNNGVKIKERGAVIILKKIFEDYDPNFLELRSPCGAVIGQLTYDYDGKIYSCDEGRMIGDETFCIGKADDNYNDIITSENAVNIVSSSINDCGFCNTCAFKPYCGLCPVCSYAEQGTIIGTVSKMKHCKIHMQMFLYIFNKIKNNKKAKKVFLEWISTDN